MRGKSLCSTRGRVACTDGVLKGLPRHLGGGRGFLQQRLLGGGRRRLRLPKFDRKYLIGLLFTVSSGVTECPPPARAPSRSPVSNRLSRSSRKSSPAWRQGRCRSS